MIALLLAAGKGTRMKSDVPKVLHELRGRAILDHILDEVWKAGIRKTLVVVGHGEKEVRSLICGRAAAVRQRPQKGTGHAVLCAEQALRGWQGLVLIIPGDAPCLRAETIRGLIASHRKSGGAATVLTAITGQPQGFGRILKREGQVVGIREELDASELEREIKEVNSGVYVFRAPELFDHLRRIKNDNRKGEYYLTDVIESFTNEGLSIQTFEASCEKEVMGINSRGSLARAEKMMNEREIEKHQQNGVTIVSPGNTFIQEGVTIGRDTVIYPFCWIERGVKIGRGCKIGPFATIRENSKVGDSAIVGCYVEVVRSKVGKGCRVKHLTYLGDANLEDQVNVGAGVVTANFDGVKKHKTVIEQGAFIGSNTVLVAPVKVGRKARTGAGSVVLGKTKVLPGRTVVGVPAKLLGKSSRKK